MDTLPILAVIVSAIVGGHVGTMLLVTRFSQNAIDVKGVVLNGVVKKASNTYGYYSYYNYEYKSDK